MKLLFALSAILLISAILLGDAVMGVLALIALFNCVAYATNSREPLETKESLNSTKEAEIYISYSQETQSPDKVFAPLTEGTTKHKLALIFTTIENQDLDGCCTFSSMPDALNWLAANTHRVIYWELMNDITSALIISGKFAPYSRLPRSQDLLDSTAQ